MCKKSIYLTLSFFVFGLAWTGPANAADPNLVLWLEFEDNADDSSDFARATFQEDAPVYIDGVIGRATDLNGNDYLDVTGWKGVTGTSAFTIAAWVNSGDVAGTLVGWGTARGNDTEEVQYRTVDNSGGKFRIDNGDGHMRSKTTTNDDEWHHIAVTVKENGTMSLSDVVLYTDGFDDTDPDSGTIDGSAFDSVPSFDVRIGKEYDDPSGTSQRRWNGYIDDLRIYDRVLSATEVRVLAGQIQPVPFEPLNGAAIEKPSALLKWIPGVYAADVNGHEVYLGDNFEDVNAGTGGTLVGTAGGSGEFFFVAPLDVGKVYYWRVNAVNDLHADTPWTSDIWSFTVPDVMGWAPSPADGAGFIDVNPTLEWQPGLGAELHVPYFGTSFEDVNTATGADQQMSTAYTPPGPLANDTFYYWRVDTYNGATTVKGPVWQFKTEPFIPIADPNLIAWWKLDGLDPTRAIDWSGHNNHGYLRGDPQWVPGYDANALEFDGDGDWVPISNLVYNSTGHPEVTVWAWIRTSDSGNQAIASFDRDSYWRLEINGNGGGAGQVGWSVFTDAGQIDIGSSARVDDGEWHHVVGIFDNGWAGIFIDGRVDAQTVSGTTFGHGRTRYGFIGSRSEAGAFDGGTGTPDPFAGTLDDVRIYDRALSDDEVLHLIAPEKAYKARPADREMDVPLSAKLIWSPGTDESTGNPYTKHYVYFSENFEDVNAGTVEPFEVVGANEYTPTLDYYNYYYWRIDGINASGEAERGWIWSFKATYNPALVVDPNLLAWYKFDGDATDSSGYGRDLIVTGEPLYAGGIEDLAMELDDVDDWAVYEFPTEEWLEYTVMAWAKLDALPADNYETVFSSYGTTNTSGFQIDVNAATDTYRFNNVGPDEDGTFGPITTEWVHLALTYDGARATLFYNGSYVPPVVNTAEGTFNQFGIGITRNRGTGRFGGKIDDVRVYDHELFDAEIRKAMRGDNLARAWKPKPGHEATGVEREPTLSWTPGDYAPPTNGHYVYFGADDPCNLTLVPEQPQSPNNYSPGALNLGTTYYWAVDEANAVSGGVNPGKIWSFTTIDHLVVDDMESYGDGFTPGEPGNCIFFVWRDGWTLNEADGFPAGFLSNNTGASIGNWDPPFAETTIVSGGGQSMPYLYDNDGEVHGGNNPANPANPDNPLEHYSKAKAEISDLQLLTQIGPDWTLGGAKALSLQFYGEPNNTIESLWVELEDATTGAKFKVAYGKYDDEDPADINDASWHEWVIALSDFTGVDMNNVKSIAIGIGIEGSTADGGSGTLYFDDIRLYVPRCFPLRAKSPADFDNSCDVGYGDLEILTDDWLISGYDFTVADSVSDANLEAHYAFEDNLLDSSPNARNADPNGTISYAAGKVGTLAVDFDGTNYAEVTGYKGVTGTQDRTCTAWIKTAIPGEIVIWGMNTSALKWIWRIQHEAAGFVAGAIRLEVATGSTVGKTDLRDDQWHHVAVVLESAGSPRVTDLKLYVDGLLEAPSSLVDNDVNTSSDTDVRIGKGPFNERPFIGQIDELRIYSRALEQAEVASLAGLGGTVTQPLLLLLTTPEDTDLFDDETINFKDYARLLDAWLDVVLWP